jgi:hypothetical protein
MDKNDDNFTPFAIIRDWYSKPGYFDMKSKAEVPGNKLYGSKGTVMGASDAYRHIVGQALYARKFGETIAGAMGNFNEWKFSEQDRDVYKEESEMDRKNNAIGLEIARKAKTEEDVYRMAQEAIKNKEAIYYDNETADKKRLETDRKKASMLN